MTRYNGIKIESWLFRTRHHKGNADELIPCDEFAKIDHAHIDCNYPEGAITISFYGKKILDKGYWDIMDQLWFLFLKATVEYTDNGTAFFFYPDSAIRVGLSKSYNNALILAINEDKTVINESDFFSELYSAGQRFFMALHQIIRCMDGYSQDALNILDNVGYRVL